MADVNIEVTFPDPVIASVEIARIGPAGPQGIAGNNGSDANVTNANVNAAISTDAAATRTALEAVRFVALTQAAYDALNPPDPNTLYDITDA